MAIGWAIGLAEEWDATYRRRDYTAPVGDEDDENGDECVAAAVATQRLRSILEAALPAFLFVCIALRVANAWEGDGDDARRDICLPNNDENGATTAISTMVHALRNVVLGTTCCVLAASAKADGTAGGGDRSTLLMSGVTLEASVEDNEDDDEFVLGGAQNFIAPTGTDNFIAPTGADNFIAPTGADNFIAPTGADNFIAPTFHLANGRR